MSTTVQSLKPIISALVEKISWTEALFLIPKVILTNSPGFTAHVASS